MVSAAVAEVLSLGRAVAHTTLGVDYPERFAASACDAIATSDGLWQQGKCCLWVETGCFTSTEVPTRQDSTVWIVTGRDRPSSRRLLDLSDANSTRSICAKSVAEADVCWQFARQIFRRASSNRLNYGPGSASPGGRSWSGSVAGSISGGVIGSRVDGAGIGPSVPGGKASPRGRSRGLVIGGASSAG